MSSRRCTSSDSSAIDVVESGTKSRVSLRASKLQLGRGGVPLTLPRSRSILYALLASLFILRVSENMVILNCDNWPI